MALFILFLIVGALAVAIPLLAWCGRDSWRDLNAAWQSATPFHRACMTSGFALTASSGWFPSTLSGVLSNLGVGMLLAGLLPFLRKANDAFRRRNQNG